MGTGILARQKVVAVSRSAGSAQPNTALPPELFLGQLGAGGGRRAQDDGHPDKSGQIDRRYRGKRSLSGAPGLKKERPVRLRAYQAGLWGCNIGPGRVGGLVGSRSPCDGSRAAFLRGRELSELPCPYYRNSFLGILPPSVGTVLEVGGHRSVPIPARALINLGPAFKYLEHGGFRCDPRRLARAAFRLLSTADPTGFQHTLSRQRYIVSAKRLARVYHHSALYMFVKPCPEEGPIFLHLC